MFLQETYCVKNLRQVFDNSWDGVVYHNHAPSPHSKGIAILISKSLKIKIINVQNDNDGRITLINAELNGVNLCMVNVYAPNGEKERKDFYSKLEEFISQRCDSPKHIIIAGDFNCCLEDNDRNTKTHLTDGSRFILKQILSNLELNDIGQLYTEDSNRFTWCERNISSRLDYFFISESNIWNINNYYADYVITSKVAKRLSDHKAIIVEMYFNINERGPGYWKLNTDLLNDTKYVNLIRNCILSYKTKYDKLYSHKIFWEILKINIREVSLHFGQQKGKLQNNRLAAIEKRLKQIENELIDNNCNETLKHEKDQLESEVNDFYDRKTKGAQIRSRATWIENGEKNTRYFFNLERKIQCDNTIYKLQKDSHFVYDDEEILTCINDFYKKLYISSNPDKVAINSYINEEDSLNILDDNDKYSCDVDLQIEELDIALKNMKRNKSPGIDGLPTEFYQFFWHELREPLYNALQECYQKQELCTSMRTAVLSILYKKGDKCNLNNYRPISLLNTDYKILTFCLANRLQTVLPKIIKLDQTGYIKNRYIGNNLRLICDIFDYATKFKRTGALIFLDFAKAFDSLEWDFMFSSLEKFNFGNNFIHWIKTVYNKPMFTVKNNGWLSPKNFMSRGIRQGCPLSALLFIISVEILAHKIRINKNIEGFLFGGVEIKLSQYADDTTLMLKNNVSVRNALCLIKEFGIFAGLSLNLSKTQGIILGQTDEHTWTTDICWTNEPVKCLGIWLGHNKEQTDKLNWDCKINVMENRIKTWKPRNLSLNGKILIIKTLLLSVINLQATVLPITDGLEKRLNKLIYNYLWNGPDKVKRSVIVQKVSEGGLKMIDVNSWLLSLKAAWVPKIINSKENFVNILTYYLDLIGININWLFNTNFVSIKQMKVIVNVPIFYREVVTAYNKCKLQNTLSSPGDILMQPLWGNMNLTINRKCLYFKQWSCQNIIYIKDVVNCDGSFLTEYQIKQKLQDTRNWIAEYFQVKKCVEKLLSKFNRILYTNVVVRTNYYMTTKEAKVNIVNQKSKFFYELLVNKEMVIPNHQHIWQECFYSENIIWSKVYQCKCINMPVTKLAEYNFKLLNKILPTSDMVAKWNLNVSHLCHTCNEVDNLEHMLFKCSLVVDIWKIIMNQLQINITWKSVVLGYKYAYTGNVILFINIIITVVSYSIFKYNMKCKCSDTHLTKLGMSNFIANDINCYVNIQKYLKKPFITQDEIMKLTKIVNKMRRNINT